MGIRSGGDEIGGKIQVDDLPPLGRASHEEGGIDLDRYRSIEGHAVKGHIHDPL